MIPLTFVSSSPDKFREVRELLVPLGIRVLWEKRAILEPQAEELDAVVRAKLDAVADLKGFVLVEDSGLFIDSLHGFPGVYSAHFLRIWGLERLLELLRRRPRGAAYRAASGLRRGRESWIVHGEVEGAIARRAAGRNGFGYDPIFV
ncbi:MAG: non-canonical purine NTP pyrophosphatase, partial [Thermoplasmata archaeon]